MLLHFKTTSAKLVGPAYPVYQLPAEAGAKQVTQAVAAPFYYDRNPSALTPVLVMWAEQSGTSVTVSAQAVECGP